MHVEKKLTEYIKRLIELDFKAVQLKEARNSELMDMETDIRKELKDMKEMVGKAAQLAKHEHDRIIKDAETEADRMNKAAEEHMIALQNSFSSFREGAAREIWMQLLDTER